MTDLVMRKLEEVATIVTGSTPSSSDADSWGDDVDFITPSDQIDGSREAPPSRRLSTLGARRLSARIVPPLSTNLTCIGSTIGKVSMSKSIAVTNQQINSIVSIAGVSDARYLYYMIKNWSPSLKLHASGSATPIINKTVLSRYEFLIPAMSEQRAIAEVLGALDDKIAANTGITERLDPLLRSIFRNLVGWPDERVWLSEFVTVSKGVSYRSIDLLPSVTALVTLKSFDRLGGYAARGLKDYVGPYKGMQVIAPGEIAVAQTDLTQAAEVVGRAIRVPASEKYQTLVASLDLAVLRPVGEMPVEFLLGLLSQGGFREHCKSHTSGTTVLHLASNAIATFRTPVVSHDAQLAYASRARPILEMGDSLDRENVILAATRDALLPQLMSGKLRVRDAETAVEAVV